VNDPVILVKVITEIFSFIPISQFKIRLFFLTSKSFSFTIVVVIILVEIKKTLCQKLHFYIQNIKTSKSFIYGVELHVRTRFQ